MDGVSVGSIVGSVLDSVKGAVEIILVGPVLDKTFVVDINVVGLDVGDNVSTSVVMIDVGGTVGIGGECEGTAVGVIDVILGLFHGHCVTNIAPSTWYSVSFRQIH